jgi:hypothetical protein
MKVKKTSVRAVKSPEKHVHSLLIIKWLRSTIWKKALYF